jgi:hypothetical protein
MGSPVSSATSFSTGWFVFCNEFLHFLKKFMRRHRRKRESSGVLP